MTQLINPIPRLSSIHWFDYSFISSLYLVRIITSKEGDEDRGKKSQIEIGIKLWTCTYIVKCTHSQVGGTLVFLNRSKMSQLQLYAVST